MTETKFTQGTWAITDEQYNELAGFFTALQGHYHYNNKTDFRAWAERLDKINIPWALQNSIACLADDRRNGFLYFRTILKTAIESLKKARGE